MMCGMHWGLVAALFLLTAVVESLAMGHVFTFLPVMLMREFHMEPAEVARNTGWLNGITFLLGLPLIPFWGVWADRYSRKLVIVRSAYVEAAVLFLLAASATLPQLACSLLLCGFQLGNTGVMLSALRQAAPAHHVGLALSLVSLGSPIGQALGPALGGWLMDHGFVSLRGLFVIDGGLSLGVAVLLSLFYREARPEKIPEGSTWKLALGSLGDAVTLTPARRCFACMALFLVGRSMVTPFLALLVKRVYTDPATLAEKTGLVAGTAALLGALISPVAGWLGDRVGHRRVLAAGLVTGMLSLAAFRAAGDVGTLALLSGALGAANASVVAMCYALLATELPSDRRSAVLNLAFVPFYIGSILGPNIAGPLFRSGADVVFALAAGTVALALPIVLTWR